ncbi:MAG: class I fructose-bisphosphate aldolase [Oceanicoccus sp.]|jgi:class I fructose-bisphosphate aldolase
MKINFEKLLGKNADYLLNHNSTCIPKENLLLPSRDFIDRTLSISDRSLIVLNCLQQIFNHGRLAGSGYLSALRVYQGLEHAAGASFSKKRNYFDRENIVKIAIEGGCNAVASTLGMLGTVSRK